MRIFRMLPDRMLGGLLLLMVAACSAAPTATPVATGPQVQNGPDYGAIIVTTDLAVGTNRVVFGIVDRNGMPVRSQQAQVRALLLSPGDAPGEERASGIAEFKRWPDGPQGVFSTSLDFDTAGFWQLEVSTTGPDGAAVVAQGALQIKDKSFTPSLGDPAPPSVTLTGGDVEVASLPFWGEGFFFWGEGFLFFVAAAASSSWSKSAHA